VNSLRRRFRGWQAWQQAPADAALAMLHLLLAADRCALSSQRRATSGGSVLGAALLLLPILLTCGATVLLHVCGRTSPRPIALTCEIFLLVLEPACEPTAGVRHCLSHRR